MSAVMEIREQNTRRTRARHVREAYEAADDTAVVERELLDTPEGTKGAAIEAPAPGPQSPEARRPRKRSKLRKLALAAAAAAALAVGGSVGVRFYVHSLHYESTDDAFVESHVVAISPRVAGQVLQVAVDDNQAVKQGDLLAQIDPAPFQAKLAEAQAAESAARGRLAQAQAQIKAAEAAVGQAQADVVAKEAVAKRDVQQLGHYQAAGEGSFSRTEVESAQAAADASRAAAEAARRQVAAAEAQVALAQSQVRTAQDEIASAAAQVRQAQLNLSYTKIVAPADGRVTRKSVEPGAYVQVGQNLLAVVPGNVWVLANFKETQLTHMRPDQPVEVEVDAYPGVTFRGHVDSLQSGTGSRFSLLPPENATGNFVKVVQRVPVKIAIDTKPADGRLLAPGMSVTPEVKVR